MLAEKSHAKTRHWAGPRGSNSPSRRCISRPWPGSAAPSMGPWGAVAHHPSGARWQRSARPAATSPRVHPSHLIRDSTRDSLANNRPLMRSSDSRGRRMLLIRPQRNCAARWIISPSVTPRNRSPPRRRLLETLSLERCPTRLRPMLVQRPPRSRPRTRGNPRTTHQRSARRSNVQHPCSPVLQRSKLRTTRARVRVNHASRWPGAPPQQLPVRAESPRRPLRCSTGRTRSRALPRHLRQLQALRPSAVQDRSRRCEILFARSQRGKSPEPQSTARTRR